MIFTWYLHDIYMIFTWFTWFTRYLQIIFHIVCRTHRTHCFQIWPCICTMNKENISLSATFLKHIVKTSSTVLHYLYPRRGRTGQLSTDMSCLKTLQLYHCKTVHWSSKVSWIHERGSRWGAQFWKPFPKKETFFYDAMSEKNTM